MMSPGENGAARPRGAWGWRGAAVTLLTAAIIAAHYLTPHQLIPLHDLYERMLYIPIILAAFWFGWLGGLSCAAVAGIAYVPHIHHDLGGALLGMNFNRTLEIVMYGVIGVITGWLSDRLRRQSERLRGAMAELTERTREIFEAEEQLRRADRLTALGQLTMGLAHEIKNPLGSIRGAAEILSDEDISAAQRDEFGRVLIEETERLDHVLGNFLDYARAQKSERPEPAEISAVLAHVRQLLERRLRAGRIALVEEIAPGLTSAVPDGLLKQVLLNLLLNAVQAMPEGGEIRIEASIEAGTEGKGIRVWVRDTGPGIREEIASRIFEPFFTTKQTGTGLGLAIVQKILANHGGTINLEQTGPGGTTFGLWLPVG